jgi:hypothetical protein
MTFIFLKSKENNSTDKSNMIRIESFDSVRPVKVSNT